jgi:hypothetical protein
VRVVYLNQLIRAGESDVALQLWGILGKSESNTADSKPDSALNQSGASDNKSTNRKDKFIAESISSESKLILGKARTITPELEVRFCQFLIDTGRLSAAKAVWSEYRARQKAAGGNTGLLAGGFLCDGGFEERPLGSAFGWRFARNEDVVVERRVESPFSGTYSLRLQFTGSKNVAFSHVSQIVPVEPGRSYRLRFARKSRNLTTDQGVYLAVNGFKCEGPAVKTQPVSGTGPWEEEWLELAVPKACEAIMVQVRRNASLMFDSKISGDYWLDGIEMEPL